MDIINEKFGNALIIDYKGKQIILRIFNMFNGQVKFGIETTKDIPVHREEIYNLIQANKNKNTSDSDSDSESN